MPANLRRLCMIMILACTPCLVVSRVRGSRVARQTLCVYALAIYCVPMAVAYYCIYAIFWLMIKMVRSYWKSSIASYATVRYKLKI